MEINLVYADLGINRLQLLCYMTDAILALIIIAAICGLASALIDDFTLPILAAFAIFLIFGLIKVDTQKTIDSYIANYTIDNLTSEPSEIIYLDTYNLSLIDEEITIMYTAYNDDGSKYIDSFTCVKEQLKFWESDTEQMRIEKYNFVINIEGNKVKEEASYVLRGPAKELNYGITN